MILYFKGRVATLCVGAIFVYSCSGVETMADCLQLTQGGSKLKRYCQSTIVGGALPSVTSHGQEA